MSTLQRPGSPLNLFFSFTLIALQGFGGIMAIIQREVVDKKRWLTNEEFVEEWAVAQIMPGPNVVNLSLILGARFFGIRGAIAALAGLMLLPIIIVLALHILYSLFSTNPNVVGLMRGISAVAAGLIVATGLKLCASLRANPLGKVFNLILGAACFVCIALLQWPLLDVLLLLGPLACFVTYRVLKR